MSNENLNQKKSKAGERYANRLNRHFEEISAAIKSGKSAQEIKLMIDKENHTGASWAVLQAKIEETFLGKGQKILREIKKIEKRKN